MTIAPFGVMRDPHCRSAALLDGYAATPAGDGAMAALISRFRDRSVAFAGPTRAEFLWRFHAGVIGEAPLGAF